MINFLMISVLFIFTFLSFFTERKVINPLTIFLGLWTTILSLSSLELFNLQRTSTNTYILMFTGILIFVLSYYLFTIVIFRKKAVIENTSINYELKYKTLCLLGVLTVSYYLKDLPSVIDYIFSEGGLLTIRTMNQNSGSSINNTSALENFLKIFLFKPVTIVFPIIAAVDFWHGRRSRILSLIALLIIGLSMITTGGRAVLINFFIAFLISFSFLKKIKRTGKITRKNKLLFISMTVIALIVIAWATLSRSGYSVIRNLYYYFAMQPLMFEKWITISNGMNINSLGLASWNGFIFPILYILKNAIGIPFFNLFETTFNLIQLTDSQWQLIAGNGITANAYVSYFFFFYLDAGIIGVIFGNVIYAFILAKSYFSTMIKYDGKNLVIYIFLMIGLLYSFVRFQFSNVYSSIALLYLIFLFKKKK